MFFMNLLNLYFLNSWLPTVINDNGIRVETAITSRLCSRSVAQPGPCF